MLETKENHPRNLKRKVRSKGNKKFKKMNTDQHVELVVESKKFLEQTNVIAPFRVIIRPLVKVRKTYTFQFSEQEKERNHGRKR